ncbi:hypothetical protein ACIG63_15820 [Streptomyces antimycoticus]|uniref:hypothetical protein n=1 Tax=Streptomyces antimycoticus TaxID=68175 RepID=UPI0037CD1272
MNVVAALGAGLAGPLMNAIGFGGPNAFPATPVLPVVMFSGVLARAHRRAGPGAARA